MKHKTLFRMLLKLLGIWLCVSGGTTLLLYATSLILSYVPAAGLGGSVNPYYFLQLAGPLFQIAAGLYLFFDGRWIADKAIPGNRPYCHECGYDLTGAPEHVCTECGTPFRAVQPEQVA